MPEHTLALDVGTTTLRAVVFGPDWRMKGQAHEILATNSPHPGWLEQDAEGIYTSSVTAMKQALEGAGITAADLDGLGVTTQRSSLVIWEKASGKTLCPLISWQDMRGATTAREFTENGYPMLAASAACKLEGALNSIPQGRARMDAGEICWGNIDSYIVFRLTGNTLNITDHSQACATGYYEMLAGMWHEALMAEQRLRPGFFPTLVDTSGELGEVSADVLGHAVPLTAIIGDQQSSALAQGCRRKGDLKFTFGTSGTCNVHTGVNPRQIHGTYPLVMTHHGFNTSYCLEGMIISAGAMLDWTVNLLADTDFVPDDNPPHPDNSGGVYVLPALQGLGSPHLDPHRTGTITGLTRSTTTRNIAHATLEGVCFRALEILHHIEDNMEIDLPEVITIDGGLSSSPRFVQVLASVLGRSVSVFPDGDATALGAAQLARPSFDPMKDADSKYDTQDVAANPEWAEIYGERFNQWKAAFYRRAQTRRPGQQGTFHG